MSKKATPMTLYVCEVPRLVLRIDQPYIFRVSPTCKKCQEAGAAARSAYGYPPALGSPEGEPALVEAN